MPYWFESTSVSTQIGGRTLSIETGRVAKQAAGAALVSYGDTVVLVAATSGTPREGIDFFPLTVDFVESVASSTARSARSSPTAIETRPRFSRPCSPPTALPIRTFPR